MALTTRHLVLRRWQSSDLLVLQTASADPQIPLPQDLPGYLATLQQDSLAFALCLPCGRVIGSLRVLQGTAASLPLRFREGEIACWMLPQERSRGLMTEALEAVCRLCLTRLPFERLYYCWFSSNTASGRVAKKAGFKLLRTEDYLLPLSHEVRPRNIEVRERCGGTDT